MIRAINCMPGRTARVAAVLAAVSLGVTAAGCSGGVSSSSTGATPGRQVTPPVASSSPAGQSGSVNGDSADLSAALHFSVGGDGSRLTIKAPPGSVSADDGGGGAEIQQPGGHFDVDVLKVTTSFATVKQEFQSMPAPYAFVKFTIEQANVLVYEIHNTQAGEPADTFQYSAYVVPAGAPGYYCATHPGSTDMTLLSEQGAAAVVAACKTLTSK